MIKFVSCSGSKLSSDFVTHMTCISCDGFSDRQDSCKRLMYHENVIRSHACNCCQFGRSKEQYIVVSVVVFVFVTDTVSFS